MRHSILTPLALLLLVAIPAAAPVAFRHTDAASRALDAYAMSRGDSASAAATVERFHTALGHGDSLAALALLASDVVVLESGDRESRAEYRRHHLPADIEFARAVPSTAASTRAVVQGDVAWVSSTSVTQGRINDHAVNSAGAELMVLSRRSKTSPWQIRAIHWSSHKRTT